MKMYVQCPACGERHYNTKYLEILNVEEGPDGQDVLTYRCPETKEDTKSVVYVVR